MALKSKRKYEKIKTEIKEVTEAEKAQCKKCKYRARLDSQTIACDYLCMTKEQRKSPVGELCKEFVPGRSRGSVAITVK